MNPDAPALSSDEIRVMLLNEDSSLLKVLVGVPISKISRAHTVVHQGAHYSYVGIYKDGWACSVRFQRCAPPVEI